MPFRQETVHFNNVQLYLLTFDSFNPLDFINHLTPIETERYSKIGSFIKKQQFVATRYLRDQLFGFEHIYYSEIGVPYLKKDCFISISHSSNIVGIAYCKDFQIGLDIELIAGKAKKVHLKFLNHLEQLQFDCTSDIEMTKLWSAKETLYKISNRNGIDFKTDLVLAPHDENTLLGKITQPTGVDIVQIHTFVFENYMITLNHSKIKHVEQPFKNTTSI